MYDNITVNLDSSIVTITLDRPEKLNAFAGHMRRDLAEALEHAASDRAARVVVITGAGRGFCAGADVKYMARFSPPVSYGMGDALAVKLLEASPLTGGLRFALEGGKDEAPRRDSSSKPGKRSGRHHMKHSSAGYRFWDVCLRSVHRQGVWPARDKHMRRRHSPRRAASVLRPRPI